MIRGFTLLSLALALAGQSTPEPHSTLDPIFHRFPFEQWLSEHDRASFRWSASVPHAELSFHQRLVAPVEVKVDGRELEARRGEGRLLFLVQITDRDGKRYQDHGSIDLSKLDENIRSANLEYAQRAFFLPGEYKLAVAIIDTHTGDHSAKQLQFRVAPPAHDFLPGVWKNLSPVEFIGDDEGPDGWYLPAIHGRLQWASSVSSPARVNVILNVAPVVPVPGSRRPQGGDMAALLPTLKAISESGSPAVSEHIALLDLSRRRDVFHQNEVQNLDWPRLKASLGEANTASIDIHSLSERHRDAQFFVSQVRNLLRVSEQPCVLVVLTKPVTFDSGEDLEPVSREGLPACRVVYIRYRAAVKRENPFGPLEGRGRRDRMGGPMNRNRPAPDIIDQLESTLKPLSPKVFDVETPEQMAKALAEVEKALHAHP